MTRANRRTSTVRVAAAALSSLALMGTLGACGGAASGEDADALSEVSLAFNGTLTVCSDMPYAPFEYEEKGKPAGFDIDLVNQLAKSLKVDIDVIDAPFDDITSGESLNKDLCDVAVSAMTITGERARVLDFSSPYFNAKQALITPRGSGLDTLEELADQRVGVQEGTTGQTYLQDYGPASIDILTYDDAEGLERALVAGAIDAAMLDNSASGRIVSGATELKVAREFDTGEQYGMAVKKDGNIPLLRKINDVLAEIQTDGTYDEIYNTYFG